MVYTIILKPILVLKHIFISLSHNKLLNINITFPYVVSQAILFAETLPPCVMLESGEHLEVNYEAFPQDVVIPSFPSRSLTPLSCPGLGLLAVSKLQCNLCWF